MTPRGPAIYVDCQSFMPRAMHAAYKRILVEELAAKGITDAAVRSQDEDDYLDE